jgi:hypothetical protein
MEVEGNIGLAKEEAAAGPLVNVGVCSGERYEANPVFVDIASRCGRYSACWRWLCRSTLLCEPEAAELEAPFRILKLIGRHA